MKTWLGFDLLPAYSCFKRLHPQGLRKPGTRLGARIQRPHRSSLGLGHAKLTDQAQRQQDRGQGVRQRLGSRSARSWPAGVGGSWGAQSLEESAIQNHGLFFSCKTSQRCFIVNVWVSCVFLGKGGMILLKIETRPSPPSPSRLEGQLGCVGVLNVSG